MIVALGGGVFLAQGESPMKPVKPKQVKGKGRLGETIFYCSQLARICYLGPAQLSPLATAHALLSWCTLYFPPPLPGGTPLAGPW